MGAVGRGGVTPDRRKAEGRADDAKKLIPKLTPNPIDNVNTRSDTVYVSRELTNDETETEMTSTTMTTSEQAKATLAASGATIDPEKFAAGVARRAAGYIGNTQNVDTNRVNVADALYDAKRTLKDFE